MRIRSVDFLCFVLAAVMVLGACNGGDDATPTPTRTPTPTATATPTDTPTPTTPTGNGEVIEVNVRLTEGPYQFQPASFSFEVGKTYKLVLESFSEFHTYTANDLEIDVIINAGETVTHEFTPTQAGEFELVCLPHQGSGMVGTITVK